MIKYSRRTDSLVSPFTDFVIRQVVSLYNQLLNVERGRSSILGVRGSLEPRIPEEVDMYLTELFSCHVLDTTSSIFQVLQNLSCIISTCKIKLLSELPPTFSLHKESQRKTSLITWYGPDSTEVHKTSHRHKHTPQSKIRQASSLCWHLLIQYFIFAKPYLRWKKWLYKIWLRTLAIQSRTMC